MSESPALESRSGALYGIGVSRIFAFARTMRCASVRGVMRKAFAISSVVSPHTSRKVSVTCASGAKRWMTARKNQAQPIILKAILFIGIGPFRRTPLRFEISHELVLRRIKSCPSTQSINGFESGRRNQPRSRVAGCSTLRPQAQCSRKGLCIASSARSKSPSKRIRVARIRLESTR